MALCKLCSTIPFDNLLPFPEPPWPSRVADHEGMPELRYGNPASDAPKFPLGFPYHENLGVLAGSALTCPLCILVQAGVLRWRELYDDALRTNRYFAEFHSATQPVPDKQRLWLTKRSSNAEGFVVLAWNPTRLAVYLLTGVSFSAQAGDSCGLRQSHLVRTDKLHPGTPLASQLPLRPVETDSGSWQGLDRVNSWLEDCVKKQTMSGEPSLPSRMLDINSDSSDIRLVRGSGRSGRYACLSYSWGSSRC
ncbi:hypothetical protein BKA80DRAFT_264119 [Phyllosticta citrichinensis]